MHIIFLVVVKKKKDVSVAKLCKIKVSLLSVPDVTRSVDVIVIFA